METREAMSYEEQQEAMITEEVLTKYVDLFKKSYSASERKAWLDAQYMIINDPECTQFTRDSLIERYAQRLQALEVELDLHED